MTWKMSPRQGLEEEQAWLRASRKVWWRLSRVSLYMRGGDGIDSNCDCTLYECVCECMCDYICICMHICESTWMCLCMHVGMYDGVVD